VSRLPLCSVSIDLDPIPCYYRIHALGAPPAAVADLVLRRCLPRFAALFAARGIRATFFVVGEELDPEIAGEPRARAARDTLGRLAAAGHELGNHSHRHRYDLARLPRAVIADEIARAHELIGAAQGAPPVGFRAPGYDISPAILDELVRLGYRYDSSVFPAPGYYAAKAAVMGAMALFGRTSGAVLTDPRALLAPPEPYRPDPRAPWRRGGAPLIELPIAVTPWARTPAIGTTMLLAPRWLRSRWIRAMSRRRLFDFELHGIDLADAAADDIPAALVDRQPDLRVPLARKQAALEQILDEVAAGYEIVRLRDAASALAGDADGAAAA
jgi:hypothetical protein